MTEKKEMLLIEKTQWEAIVSKVRDLTALPILSVDERHGY